MFLLISIVFIFLSYSKIDLISDMVPKSYVVYDITYNNVYDFAYDTISNVVSNVGIFNRR